MLRPKVLLLALATLGTVAVPAFSQSGYGNAPYYQNQPAPQNSYGQNGYAYQNYGPAPNQGNYAPNGDPNAYAQPGDPNGGYAPQAAPPPPSTGPQDQYGDVIEPPAPCGTCMAYGYPYPYAYYPYGYGVGIGLGFGYPGYYHGYYRGGYPVRGYFGGAHGGYVGGGFHGGSGGGFRGGRR